MVKKSLEYNLLSMKSVNALYFIEGQKKNIQNLKKYILHHWYTLLLRKDNGDEYVEFERND